MMPDSFYFSAPPFPSRALRLNSALNLLNKWALSVGGFRFPFLLTSCPFAQQTLAACLLAAWLHAALSLMPWWHLIVALGRRYIAFAVLCHIKLCHSSPQATWRSASWCWRLLRCGSPGTLTAARWRSSGRVRSCVLLQFEYLYATAGVPDSQLSL